MSKPTLASWYGSASVVSGIIAAGCFGYGAWRGGAFFALWAVLNALWEINEEVKART